MVGTRGFQMVAVDVVLLAMPRVSSQAEAFIVVIP
jgi:hypothetical protein